MSIQADKSTAPLIVLVSYPSFLWLRLARKLGKSNQVYMFSNSEDAFAFIKDNNTLDVLITGLDLKASKVGGCYVARKVKKKFPNALIFVLADKHSDDFRLRFLRRTKKIEFVSWPLGLLFLPQRIKNALKLKRRG